MRRCRLFAILVAAFLVPEGSSARATAQASGVAAVLFELQNALQSRRLAEFAAISAPRLSAGDIRVLEALVEHHVESVAIRDRGRDRDVVLAEVFISYGDRGRVANWLIGLEPARDSGRVLLTSLREVSSFDELIRFELDAREQFAVRGFTFTGADFVLSMTSGTAFRARAAGGITGIVLHGRGRVRFSPPDETEQGQLRLFAGRPEFATDVNDVFIRINPYEHDRRIPSASLQPVAVDAAALRRAQAIFDARAAHSYQFTLGDLSNARWSLLPPSGGTLVDFRSGRFGWLSYATTPDETEDIGLFDRARARQISRYASPDHRARFGLFFSDDANVAYDTISTNLDLGFDPARRWLSGRAELRLRLRRGVSAVKLRLAESLVVSSVASPELGPLFALRVSGLNTIVVGLPSDAVPGQMLTLDIQYHGHIEPQSLDREALALTQDERTRPVVEPALSFPIEPRYLYSARQPWYPQTGVNRHAQASLRLTVPAEYQSIATGQLASTVVSQSTSDEFGTLGRLVRTVEYRADRPVRYVAFLVTRLNPAGEARAAVPSLISADAAAGVDVNVLALPGLTGRHRATAERVSGMMTFYGKLLGDAPYRTFTLAVLEDTIPGGHSPAGFAIINQPHPATPYGWASDPVAFSEAPDFFLAHEVAHQWWGQAIGAKNYHETWTSEGFAQYMAWLYVESTEGADTARRLMARMRDTAMASANQGPIHLGNRIGHIRGNSRAFRAIVYNKSAVVLHTLRRLIGDAAFFDGLGRLYREFRFSQIATDDVERAFQAGTSVSLAGFFQRWILEDSVPEIRVSSSTTADTLAVRVDQHGRVHVFPLDLVVEYADGRKDAVTVPLTRASESFALPLRRALKRVSVDDDVSMVRIVREEHE